METLSLRLYETPALRLPVKLALAAVMLAIVAFIYAPVTTLDFSNPDDDWMLIKYELVHPAQFSMAYLYEVFTSFNDIQYSPLNTLYYYALYSINGYDPYYFHLGSLIVHMINILLVHLVVKRVMEDFELAQAGISAAIITFIWAVHPLNVESVAWISASKVVLFTMFTLLSTYCLMRGMDGKAGWLAGSLAFLVMACCCKEQAIIVPVTGLLYAGCLRLHRGLPLWKMNGVIYGLALQLIVSVTFGLIARKANVVLNTQLVPIIQYDALQRVLLSFYCLSFYLTNAFVPLNLHYFYHFPVSPHAAFPFTYYLYAVGLTMLSAVGIFLLRKSHWRYYMLFCAGYFFLHLVLVLHIIPMMRSSIVADRYMYLPLLAMLLAIVPFCVRMLERRGNIWRLAVAVGLSAYLTLLCLYSHQLVQNWSKLNLAS
ncbi:hypothetical protein [Chitinophaga deserti]|uniref:hypothetical protein n=1 Tax=Chitinophaga deserti TaxID=2164099 RepID=UPI000D6B0A64|nr:hypothetical protein [Chitinophaga deserti]